MRQRLVWSLGKRGSDNQPHSPFIYDMFYLSIKTAKDLGYHTVFYGTHESVDIIGKWVDEVHDVTNKIPYVFYDDIKVWIWYTDQTAITIDGDVFLYKKLSFRTPDELENVSLSDSTDLSNLAWEQKPISNRRVPITLRYEEFVEAPPTTNLLGALNHFNSFNPKSVVPEWNYNSVSSLNTGIIGWNNYNNDFRKHYCESYAKIREWYFSNESKLSKLNPMLQRHDSVVCHFMCERLLYNLVTNYDVKTDELTSNVNNHYIHLKGGNKFKDKTFVYSLKTLVDYLKLNGGFVVNAHNKLVAENKIIPFLYLRDKRT